MKIRLAILFLFAASLFVTGAQTQQTSEKTMNVQDAESYLSDHLYASTPSGASITEVPITPTSTAALSATDIPTQRKAATRTPRPTNTPPVVPPAADPVRSNWMIVLAVMAVLVVLLGVWINWRRAL